MTTPVHPTGSFWGRKVGPLPAWAWAGLGLGAALAYSVWSRNRAAGAAAQSAALDESTVPGDQSAPFVFIVPGAGPVPPPAAPTPPAAPPASGRPNTPSYQEAVKFGRVGTVGQQVPIRAYITQLSAGSGATKDTIETLLRATINDARNAQYRQQAAAKGTWPGGAAVYIHYATKRS